MNGQQCIPFYCSDIWFTYATFRQEKPLTVKRMIKDYIKFQAKGDKRQYQIPRRQRKQVKKPNDSFAPSTLKFYGKEKQINNTTAK